MFRMERANEETFIRGLANRVISEGIDPFALVAGGEVPIFEKYDPYIPGALLRRAYATDKLSPDEAAERIIEMANEYN